MDIEQYNSEYNSSINNNNNNNLDFWAKKAHEYLDWQQDFDQVFEADKTNHYYKWFLNGKINACYNCLDRHLPGKKDKIAYYYQGDNPEDTETITYGQLFEQVCIFANTLLKLGIKKGDRVCIYLPLGIEAMTAILACARIGAVHTVVFAGFSGHALAERIIDAECNLLITTLQTSRGGKKLDLYSNIEAALSLVLANHPLDLLLVNNFYYHIKDSDISRILDSNNSDNNKINIYNYNHISLSVSNINQPEYLDANDSLFILYTSGSTGKPKGVLHSIAGYLLHCTYSFYKIFNFTKNNLEQDIYWCTADIGWIAGHSYVLYGPLANGVSSVIYSGTPNYPDYNIFWEIIDKYQVNIFYTAPTAIRALMKEGENFINKYKLNTLRLLGSVGEPINPEAWQWYFKYVGRSQCSIIDTWWQTETGACMIAPIDDIDLVKTKPGSAMLPFYGIELAILDDNGIEVEEHGHLVVKSPWPGMTTTVYNQHQRYVETYFKPFKNYFYTGDLVKKDKDGHYWLLGRSDDVINIAGHRLGTAEIESALVEHESVAEAAVVSVKDDIKGEILYAYVILVNNYSHDNLEAELRQHVKNLIGPIVIFKNIKFVDNLPKTRSGKIMRRILKNIASGNTDNLGDTSTLVNPEVIADLI